MATPSLPPIARTGENLTIDQSTFEILGVDTGTVYGQGSSLAEALALQQQMGSGSTPSVKGRPDIYAVEPTQAEVDAGIDPIVPQEGMASVMPTVATGEGLAARTAGTLPTPAMTSEEQAAKFSTALKSTIENAVAQGQEDLYGETDETGSFKNQLATQWGILAAALLGENITPTDLRYLSPSQQAAIKSGDENILRSAMSGLNAVRGKIIENEEADAALKKEKEAVALAKAQTTFEIYNQIGFDKLSDEQRVQLELDLGLLPGTLDDVVASAVSEEEVTWEMAVDANGNKIKQRLNPVTGDYESEIVSLKTVSAGGGGTTPSIGSLSQTQLNSASSKYFTANPDKTVDDFNSLSVTEKMIWLGGGPEVASVQDLADFKSDVQILKDLNLTRDEALLETEAGVPLSELEQQLFNQVYPLNAIGDEENLNFFGNVYRGITGQEGGGLFFGNQKGKD